MPEINDTADAVHGSEQPDELSVPEGLSPLPGDDFDLEIIERLAEEQLVPTVSDCATGSTAPEPAALDRLRETASTVDTTLVLASVERLADQLGRRLDLLQTTFERELRAEATRERVVDRLHAELQDYKQDFLLKVQRPIFVDLIQLHDDIGKMIESGASTNDPDTGQRLRGTLESIQTGIEDILYRQGVEPFALEGTEFDPRKQRAVSTQTTDDPALNKRVATRLRKGFCAGDKLIRPEIVTVFTHRPSPPA
jgi:molecular chaperone GrpE